MPADKIAQKLLNRWIQQTEQPLNLVTVVSALSDRGFRGEWDERGMRLHHPDEETDRITFTFQKTYSFLVDGQPYGGCYSITFPPHTPVSVIIATIDAVLKLAA